MSQPEAPDDLSEEEVERLVAEALATEMIPRTRAEVDRQEREMGETLPELPALPSSRPSVARPEVAQVHSLLEARQKRRLDLWQWTGGALLGAAAVLLIVFFLPHPKGPDIHAGADGGQKSAGTDAPETQLVLPATCEDCCGGGSCEKDPSPCPSGRSCVACQVAPQDRFRLRLGDLSWGGVKNTPSQAQLELCWKASNARPECRALDQPQALAWMSSEVSYSSTQLFDGLDIYLQTKTVNAASQMAASPRPPGPGQDPAPATPAEPPKWTRKVSLTPDTRCKGLAVSLQSEPGGEVARLSVFVDDAQFVELGRAASVEQLVKMYRRLRDPHQVARIYETRGEAEERFVLAVGPLDGAAVQRVRWAALQAGVPVEVTLGDDYRGEPMKPARP